MKLMEIICAVTMGILVFTGHAKSQPLFEEMDVFVGGLDDVNTYRIPSLICTKKGTLLVFAEARRDSSVDGSPTHLVLKRSEGNAGRWRPPSRRGRIPDGRSRKVNMTWKPMQTLLATDGKAAFMNPVPIIDQSDGTIHLLVDCHSYGPEKKRGVLHFKSTDEGATWSGPVDIAAGVGRKALGPGVGIQMKSGRLLAPVYDGTIYSDDHGKTWKSGGKTTGPVSETQVVELADGSLMLNTRSAPNRTVVISTDAGETWGAPWKDETLTEPELWGGCQASLIRYTAVPDGFAKNRLLFSNPADPKYRFKMTVRISYDEGKTWAASKVINEGTGAYSCLTVLPDNTIGLIYETGNSYDTGIVEYYAKLSFARFNLWWLTDGKDHLKKPEPPAQPAKAQKQEKAE